jgi:O-antigen biosynthesis protein
MHPTPVDVIIPVYNQFDFVSQCVQSILDAKCRTPHQIVVVDDASTDEAIKLHLAELAGREVIDLFTNEQNLGFTRSVNFGMSLHKDRDVLLLNSDTIVYDGWLDRIAAAAYSGDRIASVNPMTTQRGSHISCYPCLTNPYDGKLEVSDEQLNRIANELNSGKYVEVHTTVGFCMYIRRSSLQDIGYFDVINFPIAYGEESDFCYRAIKAGWRHVIAGDVFVTHLEGKSFNDRKTKMMEDMLKKFVILHPEVVALDKNFRNRDPVRQLRAGLDLGRVKTLLGGRKMVDVYLDGDLSATPAPSGVWLEYTPSERKMRFQFRDFPESLVNLGAFHLPKDIAKLNYVMQTLNVTELECSSDACRAAVEQAVAALPGEIGLNPSLQVGQI